MKLHSLVYRIAFAGLMCCVGVAYGQQEKGDKEIGLAGLGFFSHTSPVTGSITLEGSLGYYASANNYLGVSTGPSLTFGGGQVTGSLFYGGEYRYLIGKKNSKVWPFFGVQGGGETMISKSGGSSTSTSTLGLASPEFGMKFYASQRTSFEISYQLLVLFGQGVSGGFADRSSSLIVFGFKHLF